MDLSQLLLNPIRIRVMQYLLLNKASTTKQIAAAMPDVNVSSLYRHINTMLEEGLLKVREERRVRGSVERLLAINEDTFSEAAKQDFSIMAYQFLMGLYGQFHRYSQKPDANPESDMLLLSTSVLMLSDEAYGNLLTELGGVIQKYLKNEDRQNGKARSLSIVSAPVEEDHDEKENS